MLACGRAPKTVRFLVQMGSPHHVRFKCFPAIAPHPEIAQFCAALIFKILPRWTTVLSSKDHECNTFNNPKNVNRRGGFNEITLHPTEAFDQACPSLTCRFKSELDLRTSKIPKACSMEALSEEHREAIPEHISHVLRFNFHQPFGWRIVANCCAKPVISPSLALYKHVTITSHIFLFWCQLTTRHDICQWIIYFYLTLSYFEA